MMVRTPGRMSRGMLLTLACVAAGLNVTKGALVLGITKEAFHSQRSALEGYYRARGEDVREVVHLVRAGERDGLIVKPERRS